MATALWQHRAGLCYLPSPRGGISAGPGALPAPGAAPRGQAGNTRPGPLLLQAVELRQTESSGQSVHHPPQGEKGSHHLEGEEGGEDDVHGSLQGVDFQPFVKEQEENDRQLREESQEPKPSQLRHLEQRDITY